MHHLRECSWKRAASHSPKLLRGGASRQHSAPAGRQPPNAVCPAPPTPILSKHMDNKSSSRAHLVCGEGAVEVERGADQLADEAALCARPQRLLRRVKRQRVDRVGQTRVQRGGGQLAQGALAPHGGREGPARQRRRRRQQWPQGAWRAIGTVCSQMLPANAKAGRQAERARRVSRKRRERLTCEPPNRLMLVVLVSQARCYNRSAGRGLLQGQQARHATHDILPASFGCVGQSIH